MSPDRRGAPAPTVETAADPDAYWELEAEVCPDSEELWGVFCYERGALGAEVVDDAGPLLRVRHAFSAAPEWQGWAADFAAAYPGLPPPERLALHRRAVQPWETAWRAHFAPLRVGRRLWITPPWEVDGPDAPDPTDVPAEALRVVIDPGQGFGTGRHPSTALALEALEALLAPEAGPGANMAPLPETLLDVGTGSGILAIAGRLLGVAAAVALDVDAPALPEVRRNFAGSGLAPPALVQGRPDCLRGAFPLVVANIVSAVLLACAADLAGLTAPGGCLILSGILADERARIVDAYRALGLHPDAEHRRDGWLALRLRRA